MTESRLAEVSARPPRQLGDAARFFDPEWSYEQSELQVIAGRRDQVSLRLHVARLPVRNSDIAIVQILYVTPHTELESVLREQVKAKNDFIATVSHKIRTQLTAVVGFFDGIPASLGNLADEPAEMLDILTSEAISLSNVVEDLLVAARADLDELVVRLRGRS